MPPDDAAVLDAPELDTDLDVETDTTNADSGATDDSAQVDTDVQSDTDTDSAPVVSGADGQLKLSEKARAELDRIKAENPKLARDMRTALFDRQALLNKVPGGVKEALATIEAYEAEGGSEAVQSMRAENRLWKDLDADFQKGDPKFIDDIAAGNPDAFAKLAPSVFRKFEELDPAGFSYQTAQMFARDMAANSVILTMERMRDHLFDETGKPLVGMERAAKQWTTLASYFDRVNTVAKTVPKAKEGEARPGAKSETAPDNSVAIEQFAWERTKIVDSVTKAEFDKNAGTRKLPAEKISTIQELYDIALDKMVRAIPGHKDKIDRFLAAKDKAGYRKYMERAIKSKAPTAMEQAFRKAGVGGKPGPAAKTPEKAASVPAKTATQTTGFTRVGTKPNHNEVNWQATARIPGKKGGDGKYIMRDGSKVLFQR